jgi:molecular chaperone GrpE
LGKKQLFLELLEIFDAMESLLNYLEENPNPNPQFIKRLSKSLGTVQKKMLATIEVEMFYRVCPTRVFYDFDRSY